jgi:hypothetical protein
LASTVQALRANGVAGDGRRTAPIRIGEGFFAEKSLKMFAPKAVCLHATLGALGHPDATDNKLQVA